MRRGTPPLQARRLLSDPPLLPADGVQLCHGGVLQRLLQIGNQVVGIFQANVQA